MSDFSQHAPAPLPPVSQQQSGCKKPAIWFGSCFGIFVVLLGIFLMTFGILLSSVSSFEQDGFEEQQLYAGGSDKVAVIQLHGVLMTDGYVEDGVVSARLVKRMLRAAENDSAVKAIVLDVDSPGGGVVASSQIHDEIAAVTKPVVAVYTGESAASGAVYVSVAADKILTHADTITGSIGVIAEFIDLSGLMDKYGVRLNTVKSGEFKDIGNFARPMTDDERALIQELIDGSYARFVQAVSEGRNLSALTVQGFADGRVYSGVRAVELGMADSLGGLDDGILAAEKLANIEGAEAVLYQQTPSFSSLFSLLRYAGKHTAFQELDLVSSQRALPRFELLYLLN